MLLQNKMKKQTRSTWEICKLVWNIETQRAGERRDGLTAQPPLLLALLKTKFGTASQSFL